MKKGLKILIYLRYQNDKILYNSRTGFDELIKINTYALEVDTTELDDVDSHFLSKIVNTHIETRHPVTSDNIYNAPGYYGVWAEGLKEFMWRIGYEIEFVEVPVEYGRIHHNEFTRNDRFAWTDFRAGYPKYVHRD